MAVANLDLSPDVIQTINALSQQLKLTATQLLQKCLAEYIEKLEDEEDYEDAVKAWDEFVASGEKAIPAEEVYKELGL